MWNDALLKNTLAPLVLRLALAAIFVYHGWHKITDRDTDWGAMWATALTEQKDKPPREVVNRLAGDMAKAVKMPDVVQRMAQLGIDPVGSTPEAYGQINKTANEKYAAIVKATGAKID